MSLDPSTTLPSPYGVPPHQQDDPHMFGSSDPNPPAAALPQGASHEMKEFGSANPNLVEGSTGEDAVMMDVEGLQGPGDTSISTPIDEPMHDAHAEVKLGQRPDIQPLNEHVDAKDEEEDNIDTSGHPTRTKLGKGNALIPFSLGRSTQTPSVVVLCPWSCPPS